MGADIAKVLLDCLKLAPRYLFAIAVVSGFLLFGSSKLLQQLGVGQLAENNRAVLGIVLLSAIALLIAVLGSDVVALLRRRWRERRFYRNMLQRLRVLTEDEKQILRFYVAKQTRSNVLRPDDGVVQGLVTVGIIYRAASIGSVIEGMAYNISEFAWNYLNINQHLLDGCTNTYRTDRRREWDW